MRLLIVDQSLRDLNGHHFDYDRTFAEAGAQCGLAVEVLAHTAWRAHTPDVTFEITPWFSRAWNDRPHGASERIARSLLAAMPSVWQAMLFDQARRFRQARATARPAVAPLLPPFGIELAAALAARRLSPADHVLIHTLSIAELHALIIALAPAAAVPRLHIVLRRDADERDVRATPWGGVAAAVARLDALPELKSQFRFYADTTELVEQYKVVCPGIAIRRLPVPHGLDGAAATAPRQQDRRLRIAYLGNARTEKGFHLLPSVVDAYAGRVAADRPVHFVIQANASMRHEHPLIAAARDRLTACDAATVTLLRDMLSSQQFVDEVRRADLILLPYDPDLYRRRSSGILIQALACGVPIVVPARSWLAATAPHASAVMFDSPDALPDAVFAALDRIDALRAAARNAATHWYDAHSGAALLRCLLGETE